MNLVAAQPKTDVAAVADQISIPYYSVNFRVFEYFLTTELVGLQIMS